MKRETPLLLSVLALSACAATPTPPPAAPPQTVPRLYNIPAQGMHSALRRWEEQSGGERVVEMRETMFPEAWQSVPVAGTLPPLTALGLVFQSHCVLIRDWPDPREHVHVYSVRMVPGCERRANRCESTDTDPKYIEQCERTNQ